MVRAIIITLVAYHSLAVWKRQDLAKNVFMVLTDVVNHINL